jgi:hypothetical protein
MIHTWEWGIEVNSDQVCSDPMLQLTDYINPHLCKLLERVCVRARVRVCVRARAHLTSLLEGRYFQL